MSETYRFSSKSYSSNAGDAVPRIPLPSSGLDSKVGFSSSSTTSRYGSGVSPRLPIPSSSSNIPLPGSASTRMDFRTSSSAVGGSAVGGSARTGGMDQSGLGDFLGYDKNVARPLKTYDSPAVPEWDDQLVLSDGHHHVGDHHFSHHRRNIHHFADWHLLGSAMEVMDLRGSPEVRTIVVPSDNPPQMKLRPDLVGRHAFERGSDQYFSNIFGNNSGRAPVDFGSRGLSSREETTTTTTHRDVPGSRFSSTAADYGGYGGGSRFSSSVTGTGGDYGGYGGGSRSRSFSERYETMEAPVRGYGAGASAGGSEAFSSRIGGVDTPYYYLKEGSTW
eukprot:NODE_1033_length_1150_cov_333.712988_g785_i0.p1 GENE.NODE_1033_length_1150_cov_333.712988_g785_i0~~NODE_1033_length_1150_cov_333.712988_g785_i0.p1  ORF type:complete len:350 (-),score=128.38 NODE_1033_length_1150_cov_333.712988_g785_i0:99-1097(-)